MAAASPFGDLAGLFGALKARDLALLDRLRAEDRRLEAEIAAVAAGVAADAEAEPPLPPAQRALRLAWADRRIALARAARARLAGEIDMARRVAAVSLGKERAVETLSDRARRAAAHARSARAEREGRLDPG